MITLKEYLSRSIETEEEVRSYVESRVSDYLASTNDDGDFHDQPWLTLDVLAN